MSGPLFAPLTAARIQQPAASSEHELTNADRRPRSTGGNWHLRKSEGRGRAVAPASTSNTLLDSRPRQTHTSAAARQAATMLRWEATLRRPGRPRSSSIPFVPVSCLGPSAGCDSPRRKGSWWRVSSARMEREGCIERITCTIPQRQDCDLVLRTRGGLSQYHAHHPHCSSLLPVFFHTASTTTLCVTLPCAFMSSASSEALGKSPDSRPVRRPPLC